MSFDTALRLTEVLLALAVIQQSLEHLLPRGFGAPATRLPHLLRGVAALGLLAAGTPWAVWTMMAAQLWLLHRYQGPYNGGSDKMTILITATLCAVDAAPDPFWKEMALSYLAVQVALSYFVSGAVKIRNPDWRSGRALRDVFQFSAYPVSTAMRGWAAHPRLLFAAGWAVIVLEVAFPLALLHPMALTAALCLAAGFHLANAICFGLHRFFWIWLCAYPALIWFQYRIFG